MWDSLVRVSGWENVVKNCTHVTVLGPCPETGTMETHLKHIFCLSLSGSLGASGLWSGHGYAKLVESFPHDEMDTALNLQVRQRTVMAGGALLETADGMTFHQSRLWLVCDVHERKDNNYHCSALARHAAHMRSPERGTRYFRQKCVSLERGKTISTRQTMATSGKTTCPRQWTGRGTLRYCAKFWSAASRDTP